MRYDLNVGEGITIDEIRRVMITVPVSIQQIAYRLIRSLPNVSDICFSDTGKLVGINDKETAAGDYRIRISVYDIQNRIGSDIGDDAVSYRLNAKVLISCSCYLR